VILTSRLRITAFGSAAASVIAGLACWILVAGVTGEVLAVVLMSAGFAGAVLLLFLEVGLGEERDLARDQELRRSREKRALGVRRGARLARRPRRPG
jgi:uncharacterized membrane protein